MEEQAFFLEIQRLSMEMDKVIDKYDMRDRVISIMVTGLIDSNIFGDSRLKAIYSYSLDSQEDLENIISFIDNTWYDVNADQSERYYDDIDDLLSGLDIDLE
jgi:hypothetical protein|tara:strand:+ start:356 stop:661 length:306 start_codon:yes stop_codon:yes gene_type:complete